MTLSFTPSDNTPASALRLTTDASKLPAGWTVEASALPCATVDGNGGCTLTLSYAPVSNQPAGKLDIDYAYNDAIGRELSGRTTVSYASHDYRVYVTDYGAIVDGEPAGGGVRQCALDRAGKLSACVKVATAWPIFGVSEIVLDGSHAYIGAVTGNFAEISLRPRQVTVCNIADEDALVDCAGSGPVFDRLAGLQVSRLGVFVISVPNSHRQEKRLAGDRRHHHHRKNLRVPDRSVKRRFEDMRQRRRYRRNTQFRHRGALVLPGIQAPMPCLTRQALYSTWHRVDGTHSCFLRSDPRKATVPRIAV